mmetsp:Transcript_4490/g.2976  ORF Transcript_4490/g.2976 Transcript_4490/m.2976 type:complete len:80 (-) Transcript_4490:744-983(-)
MASKDDFRARRGATNRNVQLEEIPEEPKENLSQEDIDMAELQDILADPDDIEYPLLMNDPDQLMEIFATLETKNLFLIQ